MSDNTIRTEGNYSLSNLLTTRSDLVRKYYLPGIKKTYGRGDGLLDLFHMVNKTGLVPDRTVRYWEEGAIKSTISTSTAITTGALGADITFKIAAGDYDAAGNPALRIHQNVLIPQKYQPTAVNIPMVYKVVSRSGSAGDYTFTARPYRSDVAQIAAEVPIGTKLTLGGLQFAPGTGLPEGTTQGYLERSFTTALFKERIGFEGGSLSQQYWEPLMVDGVLGGYINPKLYKTEFLLDDALEVYMMTGQSNANAALVQTSNWGGSNKVLSGEGIWTMLDARAQKLPYTGSFQNQDFITAKNLLESQLVVDNEMVFMMGSGLMDQVEQTNLDFIKEYSGGSDLLKNMTELGVQVAVVNRGGIRWNLAKVWSFSNPLSLGNPEYDFTNSGFIMPTSKAQVSVRPDGSKKAMLNNIELRFLGAGQENRTRVVGKLNGISGINEGIVTNQYDGLDIGFLTEPMLLFTNVNQCVQVYKEA